jgi:UDPglucose 6-dehydrogenase
MTLKVTVFGTGDVGLVTGACLAEMGNDVVCVDIDADKVSRLKQGLMPIYEPGLESLVMRNQASGKLDFTVNAVSAIAHGEVIFIAVGTPASEDGSTDLNGVLEVADTIGRQLERYAVIVNKSTVPVGTADRVRETVENALALRGIAVPYDMDFQSRISERRGRDSRLPSSRSHHPWKHQRTCH